MERGREDSHRSVRAVQRGQYRRAVSAGRTKSKSILQLSKDFLEAGKAPLTDDTKRQVNSSEVDGLRRRMSSSSK